MYILGVGILGALGILCIKFFEEKRGIVLFGSLRAKGDRMVSATKARTVRMIHELDESAAHRALLVVFAKVARILLWGIKRLEKGMASLLYKSKKKHAELREQREPSSAFLKDVRAHKDSLTPPEPPKL